MAKQDLTQDFQPLTVGFARTFACHTTPEDKLAVVVIESQPVDGGVPVKVAELRGGKAAMALRNEANNVRFRIVRASRGTSFHVWCESHGD